MPDRQPPISTLLLLEARDFEIARPRAAFKHARAALHLPGRSAQHNSGMVLNIEEQIGCLGEQHVEAEAACSAGHFGSQDVGRAAG